jgi:hypothetical protein
MPVSTLVCFPPHPFLGEWQQVAVFAVHGQQWWLRTHAKPFSWIVLAVAGVTAAPRESSGRGRHSCAVLFPPPLVGGWG